MEKMPKSDDFKLIHNTLAKVENTFHNKLKELQSLRTLMSFDTEITSEILSERDRATKKSIISEMKVRRIPNIPSFSLPTLSVSGSKSSDSSPFTANDVSISRTQSIPQLMMRMEEMEDNARTKVEGMMTTRDTEISQVTDHQDTVMEAVKNSNDRLNDENERLKAEVIEMKKEMTMQKQSFLQSKAEFTQRSVRLKLQNDKLQNALTITEEKSKTQKECWDKLKAENQRLVEVNKKMITQTRTSVHREMEVQRLNAQNEKMKQENSEMVMQTATLKHQKEEALQAMSAMQGKFISLSNGWTELKAKNAKLKEENDETRKQIAAWVLREHEAVQAIQMMKAMDERNVSQQQFVDKLEEENEELKEEVMKVIKELSTLRHENEDFQKVIESMQEKIDSQKESWNGLKSENEKLEEENLKMTKQTASLMHREKDAVQAIELMQEKCDSQKQCWTKVRKDNFNLTEKTAAMLKQLKGECEQAVSVMQQEQNEERQQWKKKIFMMNDVLQSLQARNRELAMGPEMNDCAIQTPLVMLEEKCVQSMERTMDDKEQQYTITGELTKVISTRSQEEVKNRNVMSSFATEKKTKCTEMTLCDRLTRIEAEFEHRICEMQSVKHRLAEITDLTESQSLRFERCD